MKGCVWHIVAMICVTHVQKDIWIGVIEKISKFHAIAPNFTFLQNLNILRIIGD